MINEENTEILFESTNADINLIKGTLFLYNKKTYIVTNLAYVFSEDGNIKWQNIYCKVFISENRKPAYAGIDLMEKFLLNFLSEPGTAGSDYIVLDITNDKEAQLAAKVYADALEKIAPNKANLIRARIAYNRKG